MEGSVAIFTRNGYINQAVVGAMVQSEKGYLKPFRYGVVHLYHLQMIINPLLLQLSISVGCALPDQFMVSVKSRYMKNNLCSALVLVNIKI